jgi:hypothetical protein
VTEWANQRKADIAGCIRVGEANRLFEAKATQDFIAWMEESEEEDSDEDEDDEEDEE